jgi:soluble lytic murein transglycosylase-like protein
MAASGRTWGRAVCLALGLLAYVGPARAELYSWVDEEGVIHLTNLPRGAELKRYEGDDAEGFGGEKPLVIQEQGTERVIYPVDVPRFDPILKEAAEHYRLPFAFLKAVVKVESNFNPRAVSHADAKGLMQLIDPTARDLNVADPFDPRQNIFGGARYLRMLANEFDGNMALTAAAYNAGPDRVKRTGRIPEIRETQRYVRRVLEMYRHYRRKG